MKEKPFKKVKTILQFSVLVLSVVLLAVGYYSGEAQEVWRKAVMICLECVGIG